MLKWILAVLLMGSIPAFSDSGQSKKKITKVREKAKTLVKKGKKQLKKVSEFSDTKSSKNETRR